MPLSPEEFDTRRINAGYFHLRKGCAGVSDIHTRDSFRRHGPVTYWEGQNGLACCNGVTLDGVQRRISLDESVVSMPLLEMHRNCQNILDEVPMMEFPNTSDRLTDNIFRLRNGYQIASQSIPKLCGGSLHNELTGDTYTSFKILGGLESASEYIGDETSRLVLGAVNNDNRELLAYGEQVTNNVEFLIRTVHNNVAIQEMVFRLRGQYTDGDYILPSEFIVTKPEGTNNNFWHQCHVVALNLQRDLVLTGEGEREEDIALFPTTEEMERQWAERREQERAELAKQLLKRANLKRKIDI